MPRFHIEVNGDESSAVERSATLLALARSMRGEAPADYAIHVPAHDDLVSSVTRKAEELLRLGRGLFTSVPLSPRENEVLIELLRNSVNKEIAARLRISVRTVKFHVSSLLAKFGVQSRWDLTQKAAQILGSCSLVDSIQRRSPISAQEQVRVIEKKPAVAKSLRAGGQRRVIPFRRNLRPA
ncbi:MAG TPA: helix-turn-helix transcriptional regulator [Candidatus Acidoferrales bacterium]|nr:helix-turn-helix transcriptional regulator [Candidatus Acidoferrales bacterium]